ncbi:MAG TPA: acetoacetate--CoA ligase [Trueperaceae bacterium]
MDEPLWRLTPARAAATNMAEFRRSVARERGLSLPDYDALHRFSVLEPEVFWDDLANWLELPFARGASRIRSDDPMPRTRWFEGAELSYARAMLRPAGVSDRSSTAVIGVTEAGTEVSYSFADLEALVARVQGGLVSLGVGEGDHVVALAANVPETLALLLACSGLGAVFASASPDFGASAAAARFEQLRPKALFATTGYLYGGRSYDTSATVSRLRELLGQPPTVVLPYPGLRPNVPLGASDWDSFMGADAEVTLRDLAFDHPLYVLFSSGTTGTPKAMVHRSGGALLTHRKELALHCDVRPGDVVFYFTTCGWMMWNWQVSALSCGATVVLYDGSPVHPHETALFALAERLGVTLFGTSARYLHGLAADGARPGERYDLSRVRTVTSTGSPLSPSGFLYVYEHLKRDVHLASISGGTDIVGCFMLGVPTLPVYAGEIQRPGLGVDLAAYDVDGRPVATGPGELVCRQPLPSMPLRFAGDPSFERYLGAYFSTYPGAWRHGDLIELTEHGGIVVHGRSDATLNPGGVRIGTAEVYRALESVPEVVEAAAVGRKIGPALGSGESSDEEVWLLVVLREGSRLTPELERRIKRAVREGASPRHVPRVVVSVPGLPRTRSGKPMEIAVSRLVNGRPVDNADVMANPEVLDQIAAALTARADA